ncbi:MAG: FxLYD domain-containing protein [Acidobacteriales bacterium]|nr:FxLYD domain-containing protein [Terriglobales bacterium]
MREFAAALLLCALVGAAQAKKPPQGTRYLRTENDSRKCLVILEDDSRRKLFRDVHHIVGTAQNQCTYALGNVSIVYELQYKDGTKFGMALAMTDRIAPGQKWRFSAASAEQINYAHRAVPKVNAVPLD